MKELYLEYRTLTEQAKKVQQYVEQTTQSIGEVSGLIDALDLADEDLGANEGSHQLGLGHGGTGDAPARMLGFVPERGQLVHPVPRELGGDKGLHVLP